METPNGQITPLIGVQYSDEVVKLIDRASVSIKILMFDWRWYINGLGSPTQAFNQALVRAQRRGCKVSCLVNSGDISEQLNKVGLFAKKINSRDLLHSKLVLLDDRFVVIGSHNISSHAFEKNFETSVIIESEELSKHFSNYFDTLWRL
jgi:cardiolipin synthase